MTMATRKKTKTNPGYLLHLPDEMMIAAKAMAETRGQTLADYIRSAVRMKLITDATNMDGNVLTQVVAQANEPLTRSANFGAVHAAATLAFMREWAKDTFMRQEEIPEDLAEEKAQLLAENALDEALATFEDPRTLHQFGWIERPDTDDIPEWQTGAAD